MTASDAAQITIALLATNKPAQAVEVTKEFGALTFNRSFKTSDLWNGIWGEDYAPDLLEALEELFAAQSPSIATIQHIEISREALTAKLAFTDGDTRFDGTNTIGLPKIETLRRVSKNAVQQLAFALLRE